MDRFDASIKATAQSAFDVSYTTWLIIICTAHNRNLFCIIWRGPFPSLSPLSLLSAHYQRDEWKEKERSWQKRDGKRQTEREREILDFRHGFDRIVALSVCGSWVNLADTGKQGEAIRKTRQWELQPSSEWGPCVGRDTHSRWPLYLHCQTIYSDENLTKRKKESKHIYTETHIEHNWFMGRNLLPGCLDLLVPFTHIEKLPLQKVVPRHHHGMLHQSQKTHNICQLFFPTIPSNKYEGCALRGIQVFSSSKCV